MVDHATNKQPEKDPASAAKKRREARNRNDIVGKTTLDLPSLSGLEPMPLFLPKQEPAPATSSDEAPAPPTAPTTKEPTPTPAESPIDTTNQPPLPLPPTTDARLRAIPARPVPNQSQQTAKLSLQEITGQTTSHPLKRIRLRPLFRSLKASLMLALLCILVVGGAFAYFHFPSSTPQVTKPITIHQRASPPPHIQQHSEATPETNNIAVGKHPIIELQGYQGNVNIAAGKAGSILIKTSGDQTTSTDTNNLLHYTQSHDKQGHDLVRITNQTTNQNINYEILSPRTTKVHLTIDSGSIDIDGISGVTITTTNGSISVQDVTGPTSVSTQNGDIALNNVKGTMVAQTNSGSIKGNAINGQFKAITQNGDVIIQHGALRGQSLLQTRQGSITYTGTIDPKGDYKINTQSGNVDLTLPTNTAMQLRAIAQSGTVSNAFHDTNSTPHAQVFINVDSGSITVKKAT